MSSRKQCFHEFLDTLSFEVDQHYRTFLSQKITEALTAGDAKGIMRYSTAYAEHVKKLHENSKKHTLS